MKSGGWVEGVGCAVMGVLVCGALTSVGVWALGYGSAQAKNAEAVAKLKPLSLNELTSVAGGKRVLMQGRLDPRAEVLEKERGLVMYVKERCEMSYGRKGRKNYSWKLAEKALPSFQLQVGEASMSILGGAYDLRHPSLDEPHEDAAGAVSYSGFKAGDPVLVDGMMTQGALKASVVFGGDYEAYVADLKTDAPASDKIGWGALALAALLAALAVWYIRRCFRAPAPAPAQA